MQVYANHNLTQIHANFDPLCTTNDLFNQKIPVTAIPKTFGKIVFGREFWGHTLGARVLELEF